MRVEVIGRVGRPFSPRLRARLLSAMAADGATTKELADLNVLVGQLYAETAVRAIREFGLRDVSVIGCHGQTIWHAGGGRGRTKRATRTLQTGQMSFVTEATGVRTVCDFRQADVAAGGQGAPLVPWTDYVLFGQKRPNRAIQNIGGIGNVTYLRAGGKSGDVIGFDTGPGNMIIDALVRRISDGRRAYDKDGRRAARGEVLDGVLDRWMKEPFLRRRPPKSAGRAEFGEVFVERVWKQLRRASRNGDDWVATATAFTAKSIAEAYRRFLPGEGGRPAIEEVIICGGGAGNATLMRMLAEALPGMAVHPIDEFGIEDKAKEAVSFAMLALARLDGVPGNLPQVTGAKRAVILGKLIEP